MSDSPASPAKKTPAVLPPVEPPSGAFLLQLFGIPLVIVLIMVMVMLLLNRLAHLGTDPREIARDISKMNDASWQRAYNLAEMLRTPQYDDLKDDHELAKQLAETLDSMRTTRPLRQGAIAAQTSDPLKKQADETYNNRLKLEEFLCYALGEFRVDDGVPALVTAARPTDDAGAFRVRAAAIQSIAIQATHIEPERFQNNAELMEVVIEASRERGEGSNAADFNYLRSAAAYALGMIGGDEARERLHFMLDDGDANTRYNAATGLARQGDARALAVLEEMLDPDNTAALADPEAKTEEHRKSGESWKRVLVLTNGIRAASQLVDKNPAADYSDLADWLARLQQADVIERVKIDARSLELKLQQREQANAG
jgi:HEAT repeat protein